MEIPQVEALARALMTEHGVGDWALHFDRAKRRAGLTDHGRRRISLSRYLMGLYSEAEVRDTILHEIAHARVGAAHGHDAVWRAEARRLGASGKRLVPREAPQVEGPWVGICPAGHRVTRFRRPTRPLSCARCSRRFSLERLLAWSFRGTPVEPEQIGAGYARELARLTRLAGR